MTDESELDEELEAACRTAVGDRLRSIVYFTAADYRLVYLRQDIEHTESIDEFVANERLGFASQGTYSDPELGEYHATIRVFDQGYMTSVLQDEQGVFVTTDEMEIERFHDLAEAVESILAAF